MYIMRTIFLGLALDKIEAASSYKFLCENEVN